MTQNETYAKRQVRWRCAGDCDQFRSQANFRTIGCAIPYDSMVT